MRNIVPFFVVACAIVAAFVGIVFVLVANQKPKSHIIVMPPPVVAEPQADMPPGTTAVVIFMGQSNMVGQVPGTADDWIPNTKVYTNLLDQRYWQPLGPRTNDNGIGPDVEFARYWNARKGTPLAIIKIAEGATGFETGEWLARSGRLYGEFEIALGAIADLGTPTRFAGFCWYQGENDAWTESARDAYYDRLSALVQAVRHDTAVFSLPFVGTLINCAAGYRFCNEIRAATMQVAATLPNAKTVDANDLPLKPDNVHLDADGIRTIGARMYTALFG